MQAWRAADRFDPARELKPWLYAITRRAAVDIYRRERRTQQQLTFDPATETVVTEAPNIVAVWQAGQVPNDRTVWAVPWLAETRVIFYWRKLLHEAGIWPMRA